MITSRRKLRIAGILSIVSVLVFWSFGLLVGLFPDPWATFHPAKVFVRDPLMYIVSPMDYLSVTILAFLYGVLPLIGGKLAIEGRKWKVVFAGTLGAIPTPPFLGLPAAVMAVYARDDMSKKRRWLMLIIPFLVFIASVVLTAVRLIEAQRFLEPFYEQLR